MQLYCAESGNGPCVMRHEDDDEPLDVAVQSRTDFCHDILRVSQAPNSRSLSLSSLYSSTLSGGSAMCKGQVVDDAPGLYDARITRNDRHIHVWGHEDDTVAWHAEPR